MADFVIGINNAAVRSTCPVCRMSFRPGLGPWPFLFDTEDPICEDCASGCLIVPEGHEGYIESVARITGISGPIRDISQDLA
jgi:hypothetical protein